MQFNDLKEALQSTVTVDLDALYTAFVTERGSGDLVAFVTDLYRQGHIDQAVLHQLVNAGALDAQLVGTLAGQPAEENESVESAAGSESNPEAAPASDSASPEEADSVQAAVEQTAAEVAKEELRQSDSRPKRSGGAQVRSSRRKQTPRSSGARSGSLRESGARSGGRRKTSPKDKLRKTMFGWRSSEEDDEVSDTTDLLKREYSFHGLVGEGAMGRVLRAKDLDLLRVVAYKEMSEEIAATPALASKFYGEAQITAQLDHPNIVPVYHLEQTHDGMLAYTMKLIQGRTLEQMIEEAQEQYKAKKKLDDSLELPERLDCFLRMCDAMYYAHSRGVIHRDLKPENVMIGAYGEVYVMDWGIAKVVDMEGVDQEKRIHLLTEQVDEGDLVIGTPQYMSPEQAHGENSALSHLSDQYSMGLMLYELVSLKPAVTGKSAMKIVMRQQDGEKDPLVHIAGEKIDKELVAIINKATSPDASQRYDDVHELGEDIRRYQRGEEVLARPDSGWRKLERWIGKHKQLTAFVILFVFFFGATVMIGSWAGIWYMNYVEQQERQQLQNMEAHARSHASDVDSAFQRFEGLLGVLVASSSEMISRKTVPDDKLYWVDDYDQDRVMNMVESKRFGYPVNLKHPSYTFPSKDADRAVGMMHLTRLTPIRRHFKNVVLRSHSEAAAGFVPSRVKNRIAKQGTPISWAYVGMKSGGYTIYPGHGGIPEAFDVRDRPWFKATSERSEKENDRGPRWEDPTKDIHGLGDVISCVQPIFDDRDNYLGVAGVDVTYDYLMDDLLPMKNIKGVKEIVILDMDGKEVLNTSRRQKERSKAERLKGGGSPYERGNLRTIANRMPTFDVPEVLEEVESRRSGYIETFKDGEEVLILYLLMNSTDWYYVVIGDKDEMLSSPGLMEP